MTKTLANWIVSASTNVLPGILIYVGIDEKFIDSFITKGIPDVNSYAITIIGFIIWAVRIWVWVSKMRLEQRERELDMRIKAKKNDIDT